MIRFAIPALAATGIAASAHAAEVQVQAQGPVVELSVSETVDAKPDIVEIGAGVTSQADTAVEAMRLNAREMTAVIDRIKALGIDEDDIQTTGINLNAQYDYDQSTRRQVFRGYQASNRVSVTLREVERAGEVLDALVAAGATDINGPSFSLENDEGPRAQATRAFVRNMATKTDLPFVFWDERLSTVAAERALIDMDVSRKKRAQRIDSAAAAFILQGALDRLTLLRRGG